MCLVGKIKGENPAPSSQEGVKGVLYDSSSKKN